MTLQEILNILENNKNNLDNETSEKIKESNKIIEKAKQEYLEIFEKETKNIVQEKIKLPIKKENYDKAIKLWKSFIIDFENSKTYNEKIKLIENIYKTLDHIEFINKYEFMELLRKIEKDLIIENFKQNPNSKFIRKPWSYGNLYLVKNNDDILEVNFSFESNRLVETTIIKNNNNYTYLNLTYEGKKTRDMNDDILNQLMEQLNNKILSIEYQGKKLKTEYHNFRDYKILSKYGNEREINEIDNYDEIKEIDFKTKIIKLQW